MKVISNSVKKCETPKYDSYEFVKVHYQTDKIKIINNNLIKDQ